MLIKATFLALLILPIITTCHGDVYINNVTDAIVQSLHDLQSRLDWDENSKLIILDVFRLGHLYYRTEFDLSDINNTVMIQYTGDWIDESISGFEVIYTHKNKTHTFRKSCDGIRLARTDPYDDMRILFTNPIVEGRITTERETFLTIHDSGDNGKRYRVHYAPPNQVDSQVFTGVEYAGVSFQDAVRRVMNLSDIPYFETATAIRMGVVTSVNSEIDLRGVDVFNDSYRLTRYFHTIPSGWNGYVKFDLSSDIAIDWYMKYNGDHTATFAPLNNDSVSLEDLLFGGMDISITYRAPLPTPITIYMPIINFTLFNGHRNAMSITVNYPSMSFFHRTISPRDPNVTYHISTGREMTMDIYGDVSIDRSNFETSVRINETENVYVLEGESDGTIMMKGMRKHFDATMFDIPLSEQSDALPISNYTLSQSTITHMIHSEPDVVRIGGEVEMMGCQVLQKDISIRRHDYKQIVVQGFTLITNLPSFLDFSEIALLQQEVVVKVITTPINLAEENIPGIFSNFARIFSGISILAELGFPHDDEHDMFCDILETLLGEDYRFKFASTIQDLESYALIDTNLDEMDIGVSAKLSHAKLRIDVRNKYPTARVHGDLNIKDLHVIFKTDITDDGYLQTSLNHWNEPFDLDYLTMEDMTGSQELIPEKIPVSGIYINSTTLHFGKATALSPLTARGVSVLDAAHTPSNNYIKAPLDTTVSMPSLIYSMGVLPITKIHWPTSDSSFPKGFVYTFSNFGIQSDEVSIPQGSIFNGILNIGCLDGDANVNLMGKYTAKKMNVTSHLPKVNYKDILKMSPLKPGDHLLMEGDLFPTPSLSIDGLTHTLGIEKRSSLMITPSGYSTDINGNMKPNGYEANLHIYAAPGQCIETADYMVQGSFTEDLYRKINDRLVHGSTRVDPFGDDEMIFKCAQYDICDCIKNKFDQMCSSYKRVKEIYDDAKLNFTGNVDRAKILINTAKVELRNTSRLHGEITSCLQAAKVSIERVSDYLDGLNLAGMTPAPELVKISFDVPLALANSGVFPGTATVRYFGGAEIQRQITVDEIDKMVREISNF